MLVNYSLANALNVPVANEQGIIRDHLVLSPGVNTVPDADWIAVREIKKIAKMLKENILVIELDVAASKGNKAPLSQDQELRSLNIKKAIPLVKSTYNVITLEKWLESEADRPNVATEITKQIAMIEAQAKAPNKDDK